MRRHVLLVFFFVIITQRIIVRAAHGVGRILAEKATGNLLHDHPRDGVVISDAEIALTNVHTSQMTTTPHFLWNSPALTI